MSKKMPINRKPPLIQLPTRSPIQYRGKYPDRLRSISSGSTDYGLVHIEILEGTRFIVERRYLKTWPSLDHAPDIGWVIDWNNLQVILMTEEEYGHFLGFVQAMRRIRRTAEGSEQ